MNRLKQAVADLLTARSDLCEADILLEYPPARTLPLKKPALAVGLDGVDLSPAGLDRYLGRLPDAPPGEIAALYGSLAIVTLRIDIFAPGSAGSRCHRLYEALCAALTQNAAAIGLLGLECDPLQYDQGASAQRLTARAKLRAAFTGRERQSALTHFQVRSELIEPI